MMWALVFLTAAAVAVGGWAMPNGSPHCEMRPGHGSAARFSYQLSPKILFATECYTRNTPVKVTLTSARSFNGFVLRAGSVNDGRFYSGYNHRLVAGTDHCLTHDSPNVKSMVDAEWTPGDFASGDVMFEAVVFVGDDVFASGRGKAAGEYATVTAYLRQCSPSGPVMDRWVPPAASSHWTSWSSSHTTGWTADANKPVRTNRGFDNPDCKVNEEPNCDSWVVEDVGQCADLSSYVANSCQQSCCNYEYCNVCVPATRAPVVSNWWETSSPKRSCWDVDADVTSGCKDWATVRDCEDQASYVAGNCHKACCDLGVYTAKAVKPKVSFSRDSSYCADARDKDQYRNDCPAWVRDNPKGCSYGGFEELNCKWTCCNRPHTPTATNTNQPTNSNDDYCRQYSNDETGCDDWVTSAADCNEGSYMHDHCHKSCCKKGVYITAKPRHSSSSSSSSHNSHNSNYPWPGWPHWN